MKDINSINFVLSASKVLSVNALYKARIIYNAGRPVATIYKTTEAKRTEEYLKEQVRALDIETNHKWITKNTYFDANITIVLNSAFRIARVDTQNLDKQIFDAIFRGLGVVDDSHVVSLHMNKTVCPGLKDEKICVRLTECTRPVRFDMIPKPNIIWCQTQLKELKKLPKIGIKPDIMYYTDDIERADTKIFFLDPEIGITYNTTMEIAEYTVEPVLNSSGFVYIGILGNEEKWEDDKWKSIQEFKEKMIERNSEYSGIKIKELENFDEIYKWLKEDNNV